MASRGSCSVFAKLPPTKHETQKREAARKLAIELRRPCLPPRTTCSWRELWADESTWTCVGHVADVAVSGRNTFVLERQADAAAAAAAAAAAPGGTHAGGDTLSTAEEEVGGAAEYAGRATGNEANTAPPGEELLLRGGRLTGMFTTVTLDTPIRVEPGEQRGWVRVGGCVGASCGRVGCCTQLAAVPIWLLCRGGLLLVLLGRVRLSIDEALRLTTCI
jgi:hypothetical protein